MTTTYDAGGVSTEALLDQAEDFTYTAKEAASASREVPTKLVARSVLWSDV